MKDPLLNTVARSIFGVRNSDDLLPSKDDVLACLQLFLDQAVWMQQLEDCWKSTFNDALVECEKVSWKMDFGCAIRLVSQKEDDQVHFRVIGLDEWRNTMTGVGLSAHCMSDRWLSVGSIGSDHASSVLVELEKELVKRFKHQEENRLPANKIQRTPGFIAKLLSSILAAKDPKGQSSARCQGGFTDVGQHTGCPSRDVSWNLVCSVIEDIFVSNATNADLAMGRVRHIFRLFELFLISMHKDTCLADSGYWNQTVFMLERFTQGLADDINLVQDNDLQFMVSTAYTIRLSLDDCLVKQGQEAMKASVIVHSASFLEGFHSCPLDIAVPTRPDDPSTFSWESHAESLAKAEFASHPSSSMLDSIRKTAAFDVSNIPYSIKQCTPTSRFVFLTELESYFGRVVDACLEASTFPNLPPQFLKELDQVVESYRIHLHAYVSESDHGAMKIPDVDLWSREILVVWILYCVSHRFCCESVTSFRWYRPSLNPNDLAHLNTADESIRSMILKVHGYLSNQCQLAQNPAVFAGMDPTTIEFASRFAENDTTLSGHWTDYEKRANSAIHERWEKIQLMKQTIRRLESEIASLESERETVDETHTSKNSEFIPLNNRRESLRQKLWSRKPSMRAMAAEFEGELKELGPRWTTLSAEVASLSSTLLSLNGQISRKKSELTSIDKNPPSAISLCFPLEEKQKALPVLFFLYMPEMFQVCSRASYLGQQLLAPPTMLNKLKEESPPTLLWSSFVTVTTVSLLVHPRDVDLFGVTSLKEPTQYELNSIKPATVRAHSSPMAGVWFKSGSLSMKWMGGRNRTLDGLPNGGSFNPFQISSEMPTAKFTTDIEQEDLQWAMYLNAVDGVALDRGNKAIANLSTRPRWMKETEFLAFTSLRSQPFLQYSVLCSGLHDQMFPLDHLETHALIKQMIGHVGCIAKQAFEWNVIAENDQFRTIHFELDHLMEQYKESSSKWMNMLILGQIASMYSPYNSACGTVARQYASILESWAVEMEKDAMMLNDEHVKLAHVRGRQTLCFGSAVLCYRHLKEMNDQDVLRLCRAYTGFANHIPFVLDEQQLVWIRHLQTACTEVMINQREAIITAIQGNSSILLACVQALIPEFPSVELEWTSWNECLGVFVGRSNLHVIHMDVLSSGKMLLNGYPLSGLPNSVLDHPLYRRTFGRRNFKVRVTATGSFRTVLTIDEYLYDFELRNNHLMIQEISEHDSKSLVDPTACTNRSSLPERLGLHSIWRCQKGELVADVFRGMEYSARSVSFIHVEGKTYEVPTFSQDKPWFELISDVDHSLFCELLRGDNAITKSLGRFEKESLIHVLLAPGEDPCLRYHLPRYHLDFVSKPEDGARLPRSDTWRDGDWYLAPHQSLPDTLIGLTQCIVLQRDKDNVRVIVPDGDLSHGLPLTVHSAIHAKLSYCVFDRHVRGGHLLASTVPARLHLAGLFLSCQRYDWCTRRRVEEIVLDLLRHCFPSTLSPRDLQRLEAISTLGKQVHPAIHLFCVLYFRWQNRISFLTPSRMEMDEFPGLALDHEMMLAYTFRTNLSLGGMSPRSSLLFPHEERFLYGSTCRGQWNTRLAKCTQVVPSLIPTMPSPSNLDSFFANVEQELNALLDERYQKGRAEFPIVLQDLLDIPLAKEIHHELEESYYQYLAAPIQTVAWAPERIQTLLSDTAQRLDLCKQWLCSVIQTTLPNEDCSLRLIHHLRQAGGDIARDILMWRDYLQLALDAETVKQLNPFVASSCYPQLQAVAQNVLELCVLEDRLKRILKQPSLKDVDCPRMYDVFQYPGWLVFEAENNLTIRPDQAVVAKRLLGHPGEVLQLEVGAGKTRVILPLLAIAFPRDSLLRLNFLPSLHAEATAYLSNILGTSILYHPVFSLPFSRDVDLSSGRAQIVNGFFGFMQHYHPVWSACPQYTMSMSLKLEEMQSFGDSTEDSTLDAFQSFYENTVRKCVDVFDESDEHFHHRFQIIYAVGTKASLPEGPQRWRAIQQLFLHLQNSQDPALAALLLDPALVASKQERAGRWNGLLLNEIFMEQGNDRVEETKRKRIELAESLAEQVCQGIEWMSSRSDWYKGKLMDVMTRPEIDAKQVFAEVGLPEPFHAEILAYRGLLAFGLFAFCLTRRPCVQFGIRRHPSERYKRLAVPYRASNTPAERAEYSQVECCLIWTHMSYYHDGLSKEELVEAFQILLQLGSEAGEEEFGCWLEFSPNSTVTKLNQVDLTNPYQLDSMHTVFQYNMHTIHFWLSHLVFPQDTAQYPKELVRTAWDLVGKGTCRGISGTNFNQALLPVYVKQVRKVPQAKSISATNGKMICLIQANTASVEDAFPFESSEQPKWQQLVASWMVKGCDALIDAGALVSGVQNGEVARYIVSHYIHHTPKRGVVYFATDLNDWFVLEKNGSCQPLRESSVLPAEAFVYYDDSHCRGADLVLATGAKAMLTISANLDLSKLIQACGRLRKLGEKQTVLPVTTKAVLHLLGGSQVNHLIQFTLMNTVAENVRNLFPWAQRGFSFANHQSERQLDFSLELYAPASSQVLLETKVMDRFSRVEAKEPILMLEIQTRAVALGKGVYVKSIQNHTAGAEEECERETEQEQEEEEEEEREVPSAIPCEEVDWDVSTILYERSVPEHARIQTLRMLLSSSRLVSSIVERIPWCEQVYCTDNFMMTVQQKTLLQQDTFVRMSENLVLFLDGSILLVSEREANAIIVAIHEYKGTMVRVSLKRSTYCSNFDHLVFDPLPIGYDGTKLDHWNPSMAYVQLFNGDSCYEDARLSVLEPILMQHRLGVETIICSVRKRLAEFIGSSMFRRMQKLEKEQFFKSN